MKKCLWCCRQQGSSLFALFLQGKEMIGSFASEAGRPAVFLPEQVQVRAHQGFLESWFCRSLQVLAPKASRKGDFSPSGSSPKSA
jgi:hypothetical protein